MTQPALRHYAGLGPVADHVRDAAEELGTRHNIAVVYGFGPGSVPNSDHPKGLALDFMTSSKAKGDALAADAIANAGRLGITYIIWYRRQWQGGSWSTYTGSKNPHTDHVHISFAEGGGFGEGGGGFGGGRSAPMRDPVLPDPVADILRIPFNIKNRLQEGASIVDVLGEVFLGLNFWRRVGMGLLGTFLIVLSVIFFSRRAIKTVVSVSGREAANVLEMVFGGAAIGVGQNIATSKGIGAARSAVPAVASAPRRTPKAPPAVAPITAPTSPTGRDLAMNKPRSPTVRATAKRPPAPLPKTSKPQYGFPPFNEGGKRKD